MIRKYILLFFAVLCLMFIALSNGAAAAVIRGTIYDPYLDKIDKAVVTINTSPKQVVIAEGGYYEIQVNPGSYVLRADYSNGASYFWGEQISVQQDGTYNIDMVLQPQIELEDVPEGLMAEDIIADGIKSKQGYNLKSWALLLGVLFFILSLFLVFAFVRRKVAGKNNSEGFDSSKSSKFEEAEDFENIIVEILKRAGGRATQKEIRSSLGVSEAKVSLALTDMESRGKIRKIKKGRGNVVVLKRD